MSWPEVLEQHACVDPSLRSGGQPRLNQLSQKPPLQNDHQMTLNDSLYDPK